MKRILRLTGMLLLAATTITSLGVRAAALCNAQPTHPAGCHNHRPATPSQGPSGHQCCSSGQYAAISTSASGPRVAMLVTANILDSVALYFPPACGSRTIAVDSGGPPGFAPLRI